jgi:hypothetical protein
LACPISPVLAVEVSRRSREPANNDGRVYDREGIQNARCEIADKQMKIRRSKLLTTGRFGPSGQYVQLMAQSQVLDPKMFSTGTARGLPNLSG